MDSPKVQTEPGKLVDLKPTVAPDAKTAAQLYPASYWYAMLKVPEKNEFPGTGPSGNGISPNIKNQGQWIHLIKTDSCESCHQLGNAYTRTIPSMFSNLDSPAQAWMRRVQSGQAGNAMVGGLNQLGPQRATAEFGDWTSRIMHGELPAQAPPRPQGIERNVVITQWDWADPKAYLHDEISTDKRNPNVNANGLIYGSPEESRDYLPVLDPVHNTTSQVKVPYRDPDTPGQPKPLAPSPIWGDESIWDSHTTVHNPMFDQRGRVWFTSRIRAADNPAFCKAGSSLPSAMLTPVDRSGRQLAMYDPATKQTSMIDTCFGTHHLLFAEDANNTLWTSSGGGGGVVGWLNTKMWDQTHDAQKSQGWTALVLDTNGNGKRDAYVEAEQRVATAPSGESLGTSSAFNATTDPTKDTRINAAFYGLGDRHGWDDLGQRTGISRRNRSPESWIESAGNSSGRVLRSALEQSEGEGVGLFAARHGYRPQQRRLGCAGKRAPGELRPEQVQRSAQRPDRDRSALSGRLDSVSHARTELQEREGIGQRRFALLRLGGSVRYVGARQEYSHRHRQRIGFADGVGEREVRRDARALSARLFRERYGRPHRRSEGRLEREGSLDHVGHPHSVPQ